MDVFGPWGSVIWSDNPEIILNIWPNKTTYLELTFLLKADWYVVDCIFESGYRQDLLRKCHNIERIINKHVKNFTRLEAIPYDNYDLVISCDPIPGIPKKNKVVFAYFVQEHWDNLYKRSLQNPVNNYDLFLAHMIDSQSSLQHIPASISFPYPRAPEVIRKIFKKNKLERLWVDWRTVTSLGEGEIWNEISDQILKNIEKKMNIETVSNGNFGRSYYNFNETPIWNDAKNYMEKMSCCKYYFGIGRESGAGQGLCDAASLGCICVGSKDKIYHRELCHPFCLLSDINEGLDSLKEIMKSAKLQKEIKSFQDSKLKEKFVERPKRIFEKAIEFKHVV